MKTRIEISQLEPKAYEAMMAMGEYLSNSSIEPDLNEIIRLRVSQINGCAYCNGYLGLVIRYFKI